MCSDAPDTSGMNAAALMSSQISKEALDWYKAKDAAEKPLRDAAAAKAMEVADTQLASMKQNDAISKDYWDYQKGTYRPLEQGIVADSQNYDTAERRGAAATSAMADVDKGFAATNDAVARRMAAEGVDPGSAKFVEQMRQSAVDQATARAGAAYKARQGVEIQGYARKMDAANLGRNLASNQATSAQIALTAGNSAANNAGKPVEQSQSATSTYGQGFNTALQGQQIAGNIYGQAAQLSTHDNSSAWGALGNVAGQFAGSKTGSDLIKGWLSDERVKMDIRPMSDEEALAEVEATPVSKWKYDPAKIAARGIEMTPDMHGEQTGPMAQDVAETMGPDASNGKALNPRVMTGRTMAAVKAVNKKVDRLAGQVSSVAALIHGGQLQVRPA